MRSGAKHVVITYFCATLVLPKAICVPIISGTTFFYQNIKNPACVSSHRTTTFEGILGRYGGFSFCCRTNTQSSFSLRQHGTFRFLVCSFSPSRAKNYTRDAKFVI
jgi:hypothetical protein